MSFLTSNDRRIRSLLWLFFLVIVLKNSWLCEDAFITYRVVENMVHGLGARWNPVERVQVYTHPLWMLCVSAVYAVARDMYFAATFTSLACSAAAVWLLLSRGLSSAPQRVLACTLLTFSKAFIDFSTSGLENPLSHLLLALYFLEYLKPQERRRLWKMVLFVGLGLVNRMDLIWLFLLPLLNVAWREKAWRPRRWGVWLGFLPYVAWELFSVLYYGFLFPNSAYAKLTTHVPALPLAAQGLLYLLNSISWDPITLFALAALVFTGVRGWAREPRLALISLGVLLHVAYVIKIGGDYMTGRFLTAPFLASLFVLSRVEFESGLQFATAMGTSLALGWFSPRPPIQTTDQYVGLGSAPQEVDDERGYRHGDTSLLRLNRQHGLQNQGGWVADGVAARKAHTRVIVYKNIGYYGFFAGPEVHIIDPYGIGDPLMARLTFDESMGPWASGHFYRHVPDGYLQAAVGDGPIKDPAIEAYWEKLSLVTRGPIFGGARLKEVVRFALGKNPPPPNAEPDAKR